MAHRSLTGRIVREGQMKKSNDEVIVGEKTTIKQ